MAFRRPTPRVPAHCPPGWAWLLAGVLIGIFLSFLWYLREIAPNLPSPISNLNSPLVTRTLPAVSTVARAPEAPTAPTTTATPTPRFEFYDVLPANGKIPPKPAATPSVQQPAARPAPQTVQQGNYALQVGSFRDMHSAEGLKDHLTGLGIVAFIVPATLNTGETWYRVRAGTFQDANQATQARGQLLGHGFAADVVRNQ